jgi:hypothetical protein
VSVEVGQRGAAKRPMPRAVKRRRAQRVRVVLLELLTAALLSCSPTPAPPSSAPPSVAPSVGGAPAPLAMPSGAGRGSAPESAAPGVAPAALTSAGPAAPPTAAPPHGDVPLPPEVATSPLFEPECLAASSGVLDGAAFERADARRRAHLFWCALAPYVGEADETAAELARAMRAKQTLADRLLARGVDVDYRSGDGTTLLMSVVLAKAPDAWKLRVVDSLLGAGADPRARNVHGLSALDLAEARSPQNLEALRKRLGPPN